MISEWKCFDVRELKQRRRRRQRERQKSNRFRLAKQQLCTCITLFCTFLCRHCTTTTWKCLISRFVENANTRQQLYFSFAELWYSLLEFNSRKNCQHLTNWTRWNKRDKVWSSATSHFFSQPSLLLKLPIITSSHNLFYMEMSGEFVRDYWVQEACTSVLFLPHTSWVQPVSSGSSISGATGR